MNRNLDIRYQMEQRLRRLIDVGQRAELNSAERLTWLVLAVPTAPGDCVLSSIPLLCMATGLPKARMLAALARLRQLGLLRTTRAETGIRYWPQPDAVLPEVLPARPAKRPFPGRVVPVEIRVEPPSHSAYRPPRAPT